MANGPLSSVMITASAGLLDNTTLVANIDLTNSINDYTLTNAISDFQSVISYPNLSNILLANTLANLQTMGGIPGLINGIPTSITTASSNISNTATSFTQVVTSDANLIMGNGDLSKFAQVYGMCSGYQGQANQLVNSTKNSDILAATFSDMDALTTGGVSLITTDTKAFGEDLIKLGNAISFIRLKYLGHPWALLAQMLSNGGLLPGAYNILIFNGVTKEDFSTIKSSNPEITADLDRRIYQSLLQITGDDLRQVKILLDITTEGLASAADLLNPVKMLPNSYSTLIMQVPSSSGKPTNINVYSGTSVSSSVSQFFQVDPVYLELSNIIPADQAAANQAWIRSFYQVKNITGTTLPKFAASTAELESNSGLGDINALTTPIPPAAASTVTSTLATGTGPNDTLTIYDFLGTAAGWPYTENMNDVIGNINYLDNQGALELLIQSSNGLYATMTSVLNGTWAGTDGSIYWVDIPTGYPATGNYVAATANLAIDSAFGDTNGLISTGNVIFETIQTDYPDNVGNINTGYGNMANQIAREDINRTNAGVDFTILQGNNRSAIMSLATNLHSIGTDVSWHGPAEFFAAVSNIQNIGGQAVIASMREGRNIKSLAKSGVPTDTQLKTTP